MRWFPARSWSSTGRPRSWKCFVARRPRRGPSAWSVGSGCSSSRTASRCSPKCLARRQAGSFRWRFVQADALSSWKSAILRAVGGSAGLLASSG
eukprot:706920-Prymnesium_polylepis.1